MPITDRSKIPQEKLDFIDRFLAEQSKHLPEFLAKPENQRQYNALLSGIDIQPNNETQTIQLGNID